MVSKPFSYRLPDVAVQALEALQLEGETLNQTAQRVMMEHLGLSTETSQSLSTHLSTDVDIKSLVKQEVENAIANSERLQEMIAANTSYLAKGIDKIQRQVDERLSEWSATPGKLKAR